ncbi:DNA cytosine methyltransferase [Phaeobacter inhibens]|uniref:DNA cytosine methyltransferase n=1 Tax=Phaeobacter inhibens TaxID=221822 RepID=UPI0021A60C99|nr:DNA cytosine methyltransferase [Phaeobacter inhibens]UWR51468.1 DNA cytosine methyltransferase [Phaeobacter inhibens]
MSSENSDPTNPAEVVDLFCGVGALSHGLKRAGLRVLAGYDTDEGCRFAYESNNDAKFYKADVSKLSAEDIKKHYSGQAPTVLAGCAPCQPFSTYKHRYAEDPQWGLVGKFADLVVGVEPDFVTMENVPSLVAYKNGEVFNGFCAKLEAAGYQVSWEIAKCEEFGVPQRRRRLVLLAAKDQTIELKAKSGKDLISVRDAIGNLPPISAGETHPDDPLHAASSLSPLNLMRIRASRPGGTWRDWPEDLRAECHRRDSGKTYPGVYARMTWDDPSPTMTTQCYGFGNGRFGHPEQDRAISLREAAILQSFPGDYAFAPEGKKLPFKEVGRWIGNAVPVKLAEAVGESILRNLGSSANEPRIQGETV